jgi:hypothetical protein
MAPSRKRLLMIATDNSLSPPPLIVASEPATADVGLLKNAWWETRLFTIASLTGIAAFSFFLGLYRIGRDGTANPYYAAAVKSMTESWHAFFFVSWDKAGFVSVDKPPLGLWVQALSAMVLGFHGWTILLPQVLAATASVVVLYVLVARVFGSIAGLVAAITLAVAPINVATARSPSFCCWRPSRRRSPRSSRASRGSRSGWCSSASGSTSR